MEMIQIPQETENTDYQLFSFNHDVDISRKSIKVRSSSFKVRESQITGKFS